MPYLSDLETMVRIQIRDDGTTQAFQDVELDQFIYDAIAQYSRYKPRKRPYTLNLVQGQNTYTLPTDWIEVDRPSFDYALNPRRSEQYLYGLYGYEFDPVMALPPNLGLRNMQFDWYDSDQTLIVTPTPLTAYTLTFDYFALHQVSADTATPPQPCTIAAPEIYIAMYWAAAQALDALITDKADKIMVYKAKDVSVDNTEVVQGLEARADQFRKAWQDEIMRRPLGQKGGDMSRMNRGGFFGAW